MKATFNFNTASFKSFNNRCEAAIRNVDSGSKKATEAACKDILEESKRQVPKDTLTLLKSAYYEVTRRSDTGRSTYKYEGVIGYGGNGDPVNPYRMQRASSYMLAVHENLSAKHPNGKAKFLEDPVREYGTERFARTIFTYVRDSLSGMSD